MSEAPKNTQPSLAPYDDLGEDMGLMGTKNSKAKELSRDEFLRMAESLKFTKKELAALSALYREDIDRAALLDNVAPSIRY